MKCFKPETFNTMLQSTTIGLFQKHTRRIDIIKNSQINNEKVNLVEIWEHEWDSMCKEDPEVKEYILKNEIKCPLSPREAFFGGRTEAIKLYHEVKEDEKINYVDYTSLYPYVQKYCEYPIGHPEIYTENFKDLSNYFGFIKCKIIPPKKLYFPVLPARINGKLLFALCSICAEKKLDNCNHTDDERCLDGTWCSLEINEAIK